MSYLKNFTHVALFLIGFLIISPAIADYNQGLQTERSKALKLMQDGHYKDSYKIYRKLALDPRNEAGMVIHDDIRYAVQNLNNLGKINKINQFLENVVSKNDKNWYAVHAVANVYLSLNSNGTLISGKFQRGYYRGGGRSVNSALRDRVRSIQLYKRALQLANTNAKPFELAGLYFDYANVFIWNTNSASWRLTLLTNISSLPDYQKNNVYYAEQQRVGSPANADGSPIFFTLPKSFKTATNDGERWQWLMQRAAESSDGSRERVEYARASFYHDLYGVKTLVRSYQPYRRVSQENALKKESGYGVRTLTENESIAKLATGSKRFTLPDEFNYILIWQSLADSSKAHYRIQSTQMLASVFENRQQYLKAADYWRKSLKISSQDKHAKQRLDSIIGNWGKFEPTSAAVAGKQANLWFRFRNAKQLELTMHRINIKRLLRDVKDYIKDNPQKFNYRKIEINNLGYRLVVENDTRYLQDQVDKWSVDLKAYAEHFDKRTKIITPKQLAGAYLVTAKLANGNTSRIVLWLNDTILLRKHLDNKTFYYIADAASGKPVAGAQLKFFGYKREHIKMPKPLNHLFYKMKIKQEQQVSDQNGTVIVDRKSTDGSYQWLVTATGDDNRFAYLGFESIWSRNYSRQKYSERKFVLLTDRPVYRPGQTVKYKLWVRLPQYGEPLTSHYANQDEKIRIYNPKGETIFEKKIKLDQFGGYHAELKLDQKAGLGVYRVELPSIYSYGSNTFRVEEYKKPEFEIKLEGSDQAITLGESVPVTLNAKYYYGQPVSHAKVTYKIYRYTHSSRWYPETRWDWLYGNGYWWSAYDYPWYKGWSRWGSVAPVPHWFNQATPAPELVAEHTQAIPENGKLTIRIDTAMAKQLYGDQDHRYEILAEVTDASRRTITGSTSVVVSHKPFKIYAWVDKGYYQAGDLIKASFKAQTATRKPVQGKGKVTLYKINYDAKGIPNEKQIKTWRVTANDRGEVTKSFVLDSAGQYRVALSLKDKTGKSDTGGYLFNIIGDKKEQTVLHFNPLEIISQKREYVANETANLLINTQHANSTVLLFERPMGGVYKRPILLKIKGKSTQHAMLLSKKDMPNIFVEAVTIRDGKVYTELRELMVPPEKRTLNVNVKADKKRYLPGEQAMLKVKVTDENGEPVNGDTVISVYDAAVEYVSGGSNVPELREYFWKWRRHHSSDQLSNVQRYFPNLIARDEMTLHPIGVLGNLLGAGRRGSLSDGMVDTELSPSAPAASALEMEQDKSEMKLDKRKRANKKPSESLRNFKQPSVRKQFADTAFWSASIKLDKHGRGTVRFKMPENLTSWKARVWSLAHGTRVGQGQTEVVTYKNVIVRMQAPRFFIEKDEVVLSANIHNYTDKSQTVKAILELPGQQLSLEGKKQQRFTIKAQSEQRVDWRVKVKQQGEAIIRMQTLTRTESDAVEMRFPVYVHGMAKTESFTGSISDKQSHATVNFNVPQARRINSTKLEIQYSPTLAGAMIDALPYLVDYPYGCTEQTLSRFLPTVITQNVLNKMGVNLSEIRNKQINLNPQELGDARQRAQQWQRYKRNPVFDIAEVKRMSSHGIERLAAMQLSDGGWGWFSGNGETSSAHTTAYVVHGLQLAKQNGLTVPNDTLQRGLDWLKRYLDRRYKYIKAGERQKPVQTRLARNVDAFVYILLIETGMKKHTMQKYLYRDKKHLSVYAKAMLALAFHKLGDKQKLTQLQRNIEQYLIEDNENQTAYLKLPNQSYWWFWYGNDIEAHAYYLKLLARTQPKSKKAAWLVKYLINNRKQARYWRSTRDTAVAIEALAEYIIASGETEPDMELIVRIDGKEYKRVMINKQNLFSFDNRLVLSGKQIQAGKHTISIERVGKGPIYFNAYLHYFSLQDYIKKAGLEIKVERQYYKLVRENKRAATAGAQGQAIEYQTEKYQRIPIKDLATLKSSELVEVELSIQSKNDYEYLLFEDMKPAGFEPVEVRSGYNGNELGAYVEFRDERVSFFVTRLNRGKHSVSYRMRAEIPGKFSALPTRASAMYAPELKANADEIKLRIVD